MASRERQEIVDPDRALGSRGSRGGGVDEMMIRFVKAAAFVRLSVIRVEA
jgi:hypothetical protein